MKKSYLTSLFLPKAQSHAKKSVAYVGDEGLYELWLEAIDQYIILLPTCQTTGSRF
jgi:hypothetical protein